MSKDTKTKDLNYYIDWLKSLITDKNIKLYEYPGFKNIQFIGSGSYGNVYRVNWKNSNRFFALKSFVNVNDKQIFKEVLKELKLHRSVDCHENIIRLYGITNVKFDAIQNCSFVLEYADSGTLNTYLTEHFSELDWCDKYHLASQLASAIEFLHGEGIIHRDLHGENILINQKNIKLADFGLSKKIIEASNNASKVLGVIPYVDPKSFDDKEKYKLNKKSDVYSVGVLLWQISSGYKPFCEVDYSASLMLSILNGKREKIIDGTPVEYSYLYRECWRDEPNKRPNIQEVFSTLKSMIEIDTITDHTNENKETYSMNEDEIISESSKGTMDLYDELMSNNELNIIKYNISSDSNKKSRSSINEIMISKDESNIRKEYENRMASNQKYGSPSNANASDQVNQVTGSSISLINFLDVDKLIAFIIKKHDNGITFDQAQQLISKQILQTNQTTDQLIKWLSEKQDETQYIWFLGLFYYYNIGVEDVTKAFELFSKAAEDNYTIAQVYLARCYYDGYGIACNINLAFHWYQKSVENGSVIGQFYLGNCYEFGIGTVQNEKESVYWYNRAADNGNATAKLTLANCYRLGKGVDKDESKAFNYYETLAKQEFSDAQLQLGDCYYYGIGTKVDKIQAKCWYEKATNNGNIIAKNILKKCYNVKMRVEADKSKKNNLYKVLFHKSLSRFGLYCIGKLLLKTNYERSFYYFQKAAENGCKFAQYNLGGCYQLGDGVRQDLRMSFELYKKSAKQGYINAQSQLIYCYDFGFGTEIDRVKAFELAKIIAEKGYKHAQFILGEHYAYGEGVDKDEKKAFELFNKLAKESKYLSGNKEIEINKQKDFDYSKIFADDINMNSKLGNCYDEGIGTEINKTKAFELYKIAAEKGDNFAQNSLGFLYEYGEGTEMDLEKAIYWYNKAAENGNKVAQYNLGNCYNYGKGVEKNEIEAFKYYKIAAEKGDLDALYQLGYCFNKGIGTEINKPIAFELYKLAAKKGYVDAQYQLGHCYYEGIGSEIDKANAFKYYKIAAENGNNYAQNSLGFLYGNGEGTEKNLEKAFYWYNKAAEYGNRVAQYNLGECYELGNGVKKDEIKAFEYNKKSAENGHTSAKFQLGYYYVNGIGTEIDKVKGFELYNEAAGSNIQVDHIESDEKLANDLDKVNYWYHKAAENDNEFPLFKLGNFYELGKGVCKNKVRAFEFYKKSADQGFSDAQYKVDTFMD